MTTNYFKPLLGCSLPTLMAVLAAHAQNAPGKPGVQLQEIVITAEKKTENLQKAAVAVDVLKPTDLAKAGITNALNLQEILPAVKIVPSVVMNVSIRGLGTSDFNPGVESSVAYNQDGIYLSSPNALTPVLFDMQRVEAVLGPQGTLYGRNANGGVINFITNDPTFVYGGYAQIGFGNYGAVNSEAAANIPLTDELALRVSEGSDKVNGYDSSGTSSVDSIAGRAKLLYKPNNDLRALLTIDASQRKSFAGTYDGSCPPNNYFPGCAGVPFNNPWSGMLPAPRVGYSNTYVFGVSAHIDYNLGWSNLTWLTGYKTANWSSDTAAASYNGVNNFDFIQNEQDRFFTQEVRLSNEADSPVSWVAGVYYSHLNEKAVSQDNYVTNTFAQLGGAPPGFYQAFPMTGSTDQSEAVFGDITIPIPAVSGLRLRGGLRYTNETISAVGAVENGILGKGIIPGSIDPAGGNQSIGDLTWKAGVDYDLTKENLLYFTASTGFKSGGINILPAGSGSLNTYAPEYITAEEIGSKNRFLDGRVQVNVDAFHYSYKNYQDYVFWRPTAGPLVNDTLFPTVNSQTATFEGGELNTLWRVTPNDTLGFNLNLLNDTFDKFDLNLPNAPSINFSHTQVFLAPKQTYSVNYEHIFEISNGDTLTIGADSQILTSQIAQGFYTVGNSNLLYRQPGYHQTGVNISYQTAESGWTVNAYIRNIENAAVINSVAGGYPVPQSATGINYRIDPPRTFGMSVRKQF